MKNNRKSRMLIISLVLVSCILFTNLIGCANSKNIDEFVEYSDYDAFRFYANGTPPPENTGSDYYSKNPNYQTAEQYKILAECGFNYAVTQYERTVEQRIKTLEGLQPYNINVLVHESQVGNLYELYNMGKTDTDAEVILAKEKVLETYNIYKEYTSFGGYVAKDEPFYDHIPALEKAFKYYSSINTLNKEWWVNFLPNWGTSVLGATFDDYVTAGAQKSGATLMCYDRYPLYNDGSIEDGYFSEIETFARLSREQNKDFMAYILSMGHQNYKAVSNYDDLAFQVYAFMLFGAKGINTFSYWTSMTDNDSTLTNALISKEGEKTTLYYAMQQIIKEVRAYEAMYMNSKWKGVMFFESDKELGNDIFRAVDNALVTHDRIKSYKGEKDFAIGAFEDKDGRDGFLIFNANNPNNDANNEITIKFKDAKYAMLYKKGRKLKIKLDNGVFKTTMGSCDAYYVVPIA